MIAYQQMYYPAYTRLAQATPTPLVPPARTEPALTVGQQHAAIALGTAQTVFGVGAAWVGARAGMRDKGFYAILGWAVAVGGGLFAGINLLGTLGMVNKQ